MVYNDIPNLKLFTQVKTKTEYTNITKTKYFTDKKFKTVKDYNSFFKEYSQMDGYELYGHFPLEKKWITHNYTDEILADKYYEYFNIGVVDIETMADSLGIPDVNIAPKRITAITIYSSKKDKYYILTDKVIDLKYFEEDPDYENLNLEFYQYSPDFIGEFNMMKKYCEIINDIEQFDVLTGWNFKGFDHPYIFNRIAYLERQKGMYDELEHDNFGIKHLSPLKAAYKSKKGNIYVKGIQVLDYMGLYLKYTYDSKESYSLDFISEFELGEKKIKYTKSLHHLYTTDYDKYVYYNFQDVRLVKKLNNKLNFINLHISISYIAFQNFEDTFSPVATWESIFYNYLTPRNVVFDNKKETIKRKYLGAFTAKPLAAFYKYIMSFDLNSLYPHLIMQYFISPETHIPSHDIVEMFKNTPHYATIKQLLEIKEELEFLSCNDDSIPDWIDDEESYDSYISDFIRPDSYDHNKYSSSIVGEAYDKFSDMLLAGKFDLEFLKEYDITMSPSIEFFKKDDKAILPYFMSTLYTMRKSVKNEQLSKENEYEMLKTHENYDKSIAKALKDGASVLELKQMALKILLNSCYGAFGNNYFAFFKLEMAKSITSGGRMAIRSLSTTVEQQLRDKCSEIYNTKYDGKNFVIYGDTDSCVGDTKLKLLINGENIGMTINELYNLCGGNDNNKSEKIVLTDTIKSASLNYNKKEVEFNNINYIWKNTVKKKMYKIKTNNREVIVTEDHSVIIYRDDNFISIKPKDILPTDKIIGLK
jgi:DNA polymerase elongation subunit (family B)